VGGEIMFGERIRKERLEKGISQEELGALLNKTKNNISQYETEKRQPDTDTLVKLANYFDCTTDYLLGRVDNRNHYIVDDNIDNNKIELEADRTIFPDGLTHEEVVNILNTLKKQLGIDWEKFKKK
jgi:transcriptional regulator with XRE-family HTH domain